MFVVYHFVVYQGKTAAFTDACFSVGGVLKNRRAILIRCR